MQVGYEKIAIYDQYIGLSHFNASCQRCVACVRRDVMNTVPPDRGKLVTFIVGSSKWRSLLMAEDDDEVFMTRSVNVTPKTTEPTFSGTRWYI